MYIHVRVVVGARKEKVEEVGAQRLKIAVREPAEQNRANRRVIELVAKHLGVPAGRIRLIHGHQSPSKLFSVRE